MSQARLQADARLQAGSPDRFGYSWAIFDEICPEHREQFRRWTAALPKDAWPGARFLDAGCGIGRNSYWAMAAGGAGGTAIDADERTLAVARRNLAEHPTVEVCHRSIYDLDEREAFDVSFAIGVIHHLQAPHEALARMAAATRPGGHVLIWVYGRENNGWIVAVLNPLRRLLFSRLPLGLVYHLSLYPTAALRALLWLGLGRTEYFRLIRGFAFRHLRAIVFDQMVPRIAHYWPRNTVEALLRNAGLEDIRLVWVNQMSWSACGRKPALTPRAGTRP